MTARLCSQALRQWTRRRLGCTAGSSDVTEGIIRVTRRSNRPSVFQGLSCFLTVCPSVARIDTKYVASSSTSDQRHGSHHLISVYTFHHLLSNSTSDYLSAYRYIRKFCRWIFTTNKCAYKAYFGACYDSMLSHLSVGFCVIFDLSLIRLLVACTFVW